MNPSKRHLWILLAITLISTSALAVLGGVSFQRKIDTFRWLGFEATRAQGQWLVSDVEAGSVGLRTGDRIYKVGETSVPTVEALRDALHRNPTAEILIERSGELARVLYERPPLRVDFPYLVLVLLGVVYLLIGLYTLFKNVHASGLFFLWCLASASLYILTPPLIGADLMGQVIFLVDQVARNLVPALTLHLFLVFPTPLVAGRWRSVIPLIYVPSAFFLAVHADWMLTNGSTFAGEPSVQRLQTVDTMELALLAAFALASVAALARRLPKADWEQRRQVQWMALGVLCGYGPFTLFYVLPRALEREVPTWLITPAVVPLALVPMGIAYAVLKYKLWDIGSILRDSIAYSLTALLGIFGFVLINLAVSRGVGADLSVLRGLLTFAAGVGIAGVLVPTRTAIASRLERFRYGSQLAQRRALVRLGQELAYERDLDKLCSAVTGHLRAGLQVERANLYLAQSGALVPVHLGDGGPRALPIDAFGKALWTSDVQRITAVHPSLAAPGPAERLFAAGYRYVFPLRVRDEPVGLVTLGYGIDDSPLTGEDLTLTRGLLDQAGLALENARLLEQVHRQLDEVMRLEAHNKGIFESSPAGIAVLSGTRITEANHAFAAVVGVDRPDLVGREIDDVLPVRPLPPVGGLVEVGYCEADGRERHLQLSRSEHHSGEAKGLYILVVQDITERKAMEQAMRERERLASLGMVAAGVAHEVNTPLTGISSYAQLLLDDIEADHPHRAILEKMERQTFRASQIVNNLLELARTRGDAAQPVSLSRVVGECVESMAARTRALGVEVEWLPPTDGRDSVQAHEGEMHQVIMNLLGNAVDAMAGPRGDRLGPRVLTIRLETSASPEERVRLTIEDTGPGIADERLGRIFEPFYSSKIGSGGTGLGLAISQNIMRRHGGEIRAQNRDDTSGCRFELRLPAMVEAA